MTTTRKAAAKVSKTSSKSMRRNERRKLEALKPHPNQAVFGDAPDHEIEELAASIKMRGLDHPIEILPDGTIIKGHQRVRALQQLGMTEIDVTVRYDLVENDLRARREFLEDNLARRQLGKLAMARGYRALMEVCQQEGGDRFDPNKPVNPKKQLAARLGCSAKNLARYLKVLNTPQEVQIALEAGRLKLDYAAPVAGLPQSDQQELAEQIRRGNNPNEVVRRRLTASSVERDGLASRFRTMIRHLQNDMEAIAGRLNQIPLEAFHPDGDFQVLKSAMDLLGQLIDRQQQAAVLQARQEFAITDVLERLPRRCRGHRVTTRG